MKIKKLLNFTTLTAMLIGFLAPMSVLIPQASAAVDTCTWTGGGTGTEDTTNKKWTFNINDSANWTGCNGNLPEDGDILNFPANTAPVDPTSANTDDSNWQYVINNDLTAGTSFAGITLTGDTGTDCAVRDDKFVLTGNGISLSGDVTNDTTGSCTESYSSLLSMAIDITASAAVSVEASLENYVRGVTSSERTISFGANNISFCNTLDTAPMSNFSINNYKFTGTGDITFACNSYATFSPITGSTYGNITVTKGYLGVDVGKVGSNSGLTITMKSATSLSVYSPTGAIAEFKPNIVFEGSSASTYLCKTNDSTACSSDSSLKITTLEPRMSVSNESYDYTSKTSSYYKTTLSGDITLSDNTTISAGSDTELTGALNGNYTFTLFPTSRGKMVLQSTPNGSKTANGTFTSDTLTQTIKDKGYDLYFYYGYIAELQSTEEITHKITVNDGAKLKGVGTVAGILINTGGTLAPGKSPGCIVSKGDLTLSGTYDVELAGTTVCTEYDQTDVTGAVTLTGSTLSTALLNGYKPALNSTYTIIKNDGSEAVTGEFTGLKEGATFKSGEYTLGVSYKGGDGNDVVLSVTAVPASATVADTGVGTLMTSPFGVLIMMVLAGGVLAGSRKFNKIKR